jgi:hypothetical protein
MIFEKVMTVVPEEKASGRSPDVDPSDVDPSDRRDPPVPPVQSQEDTDIAWGERHESEDDERLYRERPPHWDSR